MSPNMSCPYTNSSCNPEVHFSPPSFTSSLSCHNKVIMVLRSECLSEWYPVLVTGLRLCSPSQTFNRANISRSASCQGSQCVFAFYGGETPYHRYIFLLQLFNMLVFLWLVNFSLALEQCTLAGTFAIYYWARRKPQDIPPCPLFSSLSRAIRSAPSLYPIRSLMRNWRHTTECPMCIRKCIELFFVSPGITQAP